MKDIRQALNCLPRSLQETYEKILEKVDPGCVDVVRQTLQWLVCDVSTFTLAELYESLAIEQGMDRIDGIQCIAVRSVGVLLRLQIDLEDRFENQHCRHSSVPTAMGRFRNGTISFRCIRPRPC